MSTAFLLIVLALLILAAAMAIALRREQHGHWLTRSYLRAAHEECRRLRREISTLQAERDWFKQAADVQARKEASQ